MATSVTRRISRLSTFMTHKFAMPVVLTSSTHATAISGPRGDHAGSEIAMPMFAVRSTGFDPSTLMTQTSGPGPPSNAIRLPSADHAGLCAPDGMAPVSLTGFDPSAFMIQTSVRPAVAPSKAIFMPSGDQAGACWVSVGWSAVNCFMLPPSASMTHRRKSPLRLESNAILVPLGDHAGFWSADQAGWGPAPPSFVSRVRLVPSALTANISMLPV